MIDLLQVEFRSLIPSLNHWEGLLESLGELYKTVLLCYFLNKILNFC